VPTDERRKGEPARTTSTDTADTPGQTRMRRRGGSDELRAVEAVMTALPEVFAADLTPRQAADPRLHPGHCGASRLSPDRARDRRGVGLVSPSSVAYQMGVLQKKGYLRKDPNRPRAVDVRPPSELAIDDEEAVRAARPAPAYVPILGRIAAGGPILAEQSVEGVFPLPREIVGEGTLFLLAVKGDSMLDAAICDGDWVVVRQQPTANNGEIVAAMLDGEATVKTYRFRDNHVWLMPHNPAFEPIPATKRPSSARWWRSSAACKRPLRTACRRPPAPLNVHNRLRPPREPPTGWWAVLLCPPRHTQ
jgi:repressor LexA